MAAFAHINDKAVRATVRITGYPQKNKTFKYVDHGGKRKATVAAKDWAVSAEMAVKKSDAEVARKAKYRTFYDVADVYAQTRCGFRFDGQTPREALTTFLKKGDNRCIPLGDRKPISGSSLKVTICYLTWWVNWFDGRALDKITSQHVNDGLDFLNDGERQPASVNRYQSIIHSTFNLVISGRRNRHEWVEKNPAPRGKLREDNRREVVLTTKEQIRLSKACVKSDNADLYLIFLLGLTTGARQGNVMGLRWDYLDLKTGRVDIPAKAMKNGKRFSTWIAGEALEILNWKRKQLKAAKVRNLYNGEYVFPSTETKFEAGFPRKSWYAALDKAGINRRVDPNSTKDTGFHYHDLRHSFATKAAAKGATQQQLMKVMGHQSPQMTARYVEMDIDDIRHLFD